MHVLAHLDSKRPIIWNAFTIHPLPETSGRGEEGHKTSSKKDSQVLHALNVWIDVHPHSKYLYQYSSYWLVLSQSIQRPSHHFIPIQSPHGSTHWQWSSHMPQYSVLSIGGVVGDTIRARELQRTFPKAGNEHVRHSPIIKVQMLKLLFKSPRPRSTLEQ